MKHKGLALAFTLLCSLALASPASALSQKLTASDGAAGDLLGYSSAVDGNTLVIGAPNDGAMEGAVYAYQRKGQSWIKTAKLTASDGAAGDQLGWSVAIDGETIVAGAPGDTIGSQDSQGSVYTFARRGGAKRMETAKLVYSGGSRLDSLGYSVAINGDTIVAGAPELIGRGASGWLCTFTLTGPILRQETAKLTAVNSGTAFNPNIGYSVAIDGDTIVAGSNYTDIYTDIANKSDQGAAYTFASTGPVNRSQTATLFASDGLSDDQLGYSVAIQGNTIVVGAQGDDIGTNADQGSAYTFARNGENRFERAKLTATDGTANSNLGYSVAIDGETILAGAPDADIGSKLNQGTAYVYARGGGTRYETGKLTAPDGAAYDIFGRSVAVDGSTILVGSPADDIAGVIDQGSARVFTVDFSPPNTTGLEGPKKVKQGKDGKFKFKSSEEGSTFSCRLDKEKARACSSPLKLETRKIKPNKHTLTVIATDAAGNVDPSPAKLEFKVVKR